MSKWVSPLRLFKSCPQLCGTYVPILFLHPESWHNTGRHVLSAVYISHKLGSYCCHQLNRYIEIIHWSHQQQNISGFIFCWEWPQTDHLCMEHQCDNKVIHAKTLFSAVCLQYLDWWSLVSATEKCHIQQKCVGFDVFVEPPRNSKRLRHSSP